MLFTFVVMANRWINLLVGRFFGELSKEKFDKSLSSPDALVPFNKNYLLEQLYRFKLLILIYFFSQLYTILKNMFFVLLNKDYIENGTCLSLYGEEKEIVFYDYFDQDKNFFMLIEIAEYFFRVVFCYFILIIMILIIVKAEFNYIKESDSILVASTSRDKDDLKNEMIKGLNFDYGQKE